MNRIGLIIVVFLLVSCDKNVEIGRTANGKIKYRAELKDGVRNGIFTEYYLDGSIESTATWRDGEMNGEIRYFYEDGSLQAKAIWKNGHRVDLYEYYYPNGEIQERRYYNSVGNMIYLRKNNQTGKTEFETLTPEIEAISDTVKQGQNLELKISFEIPIYGSLSLEIGRRNFTDSVNFDYEKDTLVIRDDRGLYNYSTKYVNTGKNKITLWLQYENSPKDTVSFEGLIKDFEFFVDTP